MIFELPKLPYGLNELEPVISSKTLEFHYGKHHATYATNLNNLIKDTKFANLSIEEIVKTAEAGMFNNAAQYWNHTFYFEALQKPIANNLPVGRIGEELNKNFDNFEDFKMMFSAAATTFFGSGWVWLCVDEAGKLQIIQTSNAGNPMLANMKPLMTIDVWEHAYYLDYQNRRLDYVNNYWDIINWEKVNSRF